MLRPLVTEFKVIGNGFKTLKEIQKSYEDLKNSFKKNQGLTGVFKSASNGFNTMVSKIKSGTVRVGSAFINMRTRAETALNRMNKSGGGLLGTLTKVAGIVGGGMLIKNAFEGATTLEMQRTAIASMRGEQRASELMKFGVNFANVTPYQTSEVLDAVKTLEIRGLDPTKYLQGIGDMSAMLGKPLEQGVEAILDAMTGEFERLKEFGITKKMLEEQISVGSFDNKGSLINQKKMFDDLMKYINKSYIGGMEKLSRTTVGLMSTVKGVYGSFTNLLFTGSQTGEIADKSPLGVFRKEVLLPLADNMMRWQEDGTFTRWSDQFSQAFTKFYGAVKSGISFLWEHREALISLMSGYIAFKMALAALNIAIMLTNPLGLATAAITALAGAFVYAYRNFEPFREFVLWVGENVLSVFQKVADIFSRIGEIIETAFNNPLQAAKMLISDLIDLSIEFTKNNPLLKPIMSASSWAFEKVTSIGSNLNEDRVERRERLSEPVNRINNNKVTQPIININGGDTAQVRKVVEDVIFENEIRRGER